MENRLNVGQVIDRVENEVDDVIEESWILDWIDSALSEIAIFYGDPASTTIEAEPKDFYPLPEDFLKEEEIFTEHGHKCYSYITTSQREIMFPLGGTYTVNYYKMPPRLIRENPHEPEEEDYDPEFLRNQNLPVHPLFHQSIVLWCKAEYWEFESDAKQAETYQSRRMREMFFQKVSEVSKILKNQVKQPQTIRLPHWNLGVPNEWPL